MSLFQSLVGGGSAQPTPLLPQVSDAYARDPRTALVQSIIDSGQEQLKQPTLGTGATLAKALTVGLGGISSMLEAKQYQDQNAGALKTLKDAISAGTGSQASVDPTTGATIPAVAPNIQKMQDILASNPYTASQALQSQLTMAQNMGQARANQTTELIKQGKIQDPQTGQIVPLPGILQTNQQLAGAQSSGEEGGKNAADLAGKPAIAAATDAAENPAMIARAAAIAAQEAKFKPGPQTYIKNPDGSYSEVQTSAAQLPAIAAGNGITPNPKAALPPGAPDLPPGVAAAASGNGIAPTISLPGARPVAPIVSPAPSAANGSIQTPMPPQQGAQPNAPTIGKPFAEPDVIAGRSKAFDDLRSGYNQGIQTLNQASRLQELLKQLPNSGPLTDALGRPSAILQQLGVSPDDIKEIGLPPAATWEEAQNARLKLLGTVLHAQFPQRITNSDISVFGPSVTGAENLPAAADYILHQEIIPNATRDIGRFSSVANLPNSDPTLSGMDSALMNYDKGNPLPVTAVTSGGVAIPQGLTHDQMVQEALRRGLKPQ